MSNIPKNIWIVVSSSLRKWSQSPMTMESEMFTKEQATIYAKELLTKYDSDFYIVEVDLTNKEQVSL